MPCNINLSRRTKSDMNSWLACNYRKARRAIASPRKARKGERRGFPASRQGP